MPRRAKTATEKLRHLRDYAFEQDQTRTVGKATVDEWTQGYVQAMRDIQHHANTLLEQLGSSR